MSAARLHLIIEALRLAFADARRFVADPEHAAVPVDQLLSKEYAARRRRLISPAQALTDVAPRLPDRGGTVYLCAADAEGRMVSFIQSNYMGFGSGIVVPGTGIALQNRGHGFTLEEGHPNRVAPGKRPYHPSSRASSPKTACPWPHSASWAATCSRKGTSTRCWASSTTASTRSRCLTRPGCAWRPTGRCMWNPRCTPTSSSSWPGSGTVSMSAPRGRLGGRQMIWRIRNGRAHRRYRAAQRRRRGRVVGGPRGGGAG